ERNIIARTARFRRPSARSGAAENAGDHSIPLSRTELVQTAARISELRPASLAGGPRPSINGLPRRLSPRRHRFHHPFLHQLSKLSARSLLSGPPLASPLLGYTCAGTAKETFSIRA